jgi:hypothetical protein
MSLWKRTMDYLGLGPDDAYDDYDDYDEPEAPSRPSRGPRDVEPRPAGREPTRMGTGARTDGSHRVGPAELPVT